MARKRDMRDSQLTHIARYGDMAKGILHAILCF